MRNNQGMGPEALAWVKARSNGGLAEGLGQKGRKKDGGGVFEKHSGHRTCVRRKREEWLSKGTSIL